MIPGCYCPLPQHVALPQVSCFPPHLLLPLISLVCMLSGGSFGGQVSPNGLPFLQRVHKQNKTQFPDHLPMAGGQFGFGLDGAQGTNPGSGSTRCTIGKSIHSPGEKWNPGIGRTLLKAGGYPFLHGCLPTCLLLPVFQAFIFFPAVTPAPAHSVRQDSYAPLPRFSSLMGPPHCR